MTGAGRLYVLDARNGVERRQMLAWVREVDRSASRSGDPNCVVVHFAAERAQRLDALAVRLDDVDTTEVVPVRLAWRMPHAERAHGPRLRDLVLGDPRVPGRLRATFILLRDRSRAHCLVGAAATIGDLRRRFASQVAEAEHSDPLTFAGFVARQAALTLDSEERGLHGSRYKAPRFVAESILTSVGFRAALERIAGEARRSSAELLSESRRYLREVVSTPSAFFLDLRAQFDRHFLLRGYERDIRCSAGELERLRALMRVHPTLLLFTHKTYADAALPGLLLYRHDMPMLHTFGGINLDLPGFGALMRRSGGIFIRRSFQENPVYKLVLRKYIAYLLGKRFPMSWALEGTRSRLGKLMPPRYGLLKYTLDAAHEAGIENVHIVPFVTSFELIRDVEEYAAEQIGRAKQPESLRWLITHFLGIRKPMGRVRVDLGEPVVVSRAPAPDDKLSLVKIALDVSAHANRVTPLTVTGVVCLVLLGTAPRGVTAPELVKLVAVLGAWARARGIRMSDELESDDRSAFFVKLDQLATSGLLIRSDAGHSVVYAIEPSRHAIASYYRNTIVHHFLHKAIIELALCKAERGRAGRPRGSVLG